MSDDGHMMMDGNGTDTTDPACEDDLIDRLFHAISAPFLLLEEAIEAVDLDLVASDVRCLGTNQAAAAGILLHAEDDEMR